MTIDREKLARLARITIEIEPEDLVIEGNAMASGDPEVDREAEQWIKDQLDAGNDWAWCYVVVTASYAGIKAWDTLGGCSYESEADFKQPGGYYDDMVGNALDQLAVLLADADAQIAEVRS